MVAHTWTTAVLEDLHCHVEGLVLDRAQLALRDPGRSRDRASRHAGGHPALVVLKLHLESTDFNGFQVISDVTVVSLLRPLYTQPKLESCSFTPTLKSFEWQCEPKLVLARTLATSSHHLPFDCRVSYLSSHLIFFDYCILPCCWNYHGQLSYRRVIAVWIRKVKKCVSKHALFLKCGSKMYFKNRQKIEALFSVPSAFDFMFLLLVVIVLL